jgi:Zn-dependent protease
MSYSSKIGTVEQMDLLLSWIVLAIGFSIVMGGKIVPSADLFLASALIAGTGFLLHELAHKFVAQRYGYWAEYRANRSGLLFIIIMSFMGFIFAAPGAVMIHKSTEASLRSACSSGDETCLGLITKKAKREMLWISLAGPMTNIVLSALFFALVYGSIIEDRMLAGTAYFAFFINLSLAAFNLIPIGPLDGRKIFEADRYVWIIVAVPTILMAISIMFGIGI